MRALDPPAGTGADLRALAPPRVHHRSETRGLVRRAHGKLVIVDLAEHHGAVAPQVRRDGRLIGRYEIIEDPRARRGAHALGAEQILDAERNAFERTTLAF